MSRGVLALALVSACTSAVGAPTAPAPATVIRVVPLAQRPARAAAITAELAPLRVDRVTVDFAGFPSELALTLDAAPAHPAERALAIIRAHPALFGVRAPAELVADVDGDVIRIGAGARWTGSIAVRFDGATATIYDHLWPIATEAITVPPAIERLVRPFYGKTATYLSRCLPGCGHPDSTEVLGPGSFAFDPGMALVCTPEGAVVRAAIRIRGTYRAGARVAGIDALPLLVDAHTLAPLVTSVWQDVVMPGDGARDGSGVHLGERWLADRGGCFDADR